MNNICLGGLSRKGRAAGSRSQAGFTVLEIVIVLVVASILLTLAVVSYFRVTSKAEDTEALNNLAAVRKAQMSEAAARGTFVNATDTEDINKRLTDVQIEDKGFTYKIVNVTADDFAVVAERVDEDGTHEKPIVIAMYADGHVGYTYPSGSSYGGGSGYGGGGSSGGGSSGGFSGGSLGGSSGSGSSGSSSGGSSGDDSGGAGGGTGSFGVMGFTQPPIATGNDWFIAIGWAGMSTYPDYYDIYRSTSLTGDFTLLYDNWYGLTDYFTDLTVTNDTTYYYRLDAYYGDVATYASDIISAAPSATSVYALQAAETLAELTTSATGSTIADIISAYNVNVGFGSCNSLAAAWYEPIFNTIRIDLNEFSKTQEVQAALLAHEGTHAWWTNDTSQGQPERGTNVGDSIDQEYNAFVNGAAVWKDVKAGQMDFNQDGWAGVVDQGEAQAKEIIRSSFCALRYPKGWTLRESKGRTETYSQVHIFGERDKDLGFGPSVTLTVYPKKDKGGVYTSARALADHAVQAAQGLSSFKLESQGAVKLPFGIEALRCVMTYVLRLPLYQVNAKDVCLKEETYYFEKGNHIHVLSYKNTDVDFAAQESLFLGVLESFKPA